MASASVTNEQLSTFIEKALKPQLPYSLPLLRRCQHHLRHNPHDSGPDIWVVSASLDQKLQADLQQGRYGILNEPQADPWLAVHADLTHAGQTQVWTFASWEGLFSASPNPAGAAQEFRDFSTYQKLFDALFDHLRRVHIPRLPQDPPQAWLRLRETGKILSIPYSRSKVLFGTLAECHWPVLSNLDSASGGPKTSRRHTGYLKYLVASKAESMAAMDAPPHLHFAPMQREHLQITLDRTDIPRSMETLLQIHNIALFDQNETLVAWGFLGKDASLSSLHTEPEYRRQGLAEIVSKRLLADQVELFVDSNTAGQRADYIVYSHADVHESNLASRKTMEKLGAKPMWTVAWIEVDLG